MYIKYGIVNIFIYYFPCFQFGLFTVYYYLFIITIIVRNLKKYSTHSILAFGAVFYFVFYGVLVGLMVAGGAVVYLTLNWNVPRLQGPDSLLELSPCMLYTVFL